MKTLSIAEELTGTSAGSRVAGPFALLTYVGPAGPRCGIASGDGFVDAAEATGIAKDISMNAILDDWDVSLYRLRKAVGRGQIMPLSEAKLLAPLLPGAIYCAGANYKDHVANMAKNTGLPLEPNPREAGLLPWHFMKPFSTVVGDRATVSVHSAALDWEAELVAVIGKTAFQVPVERALEYVAGYTMANDLSARDFAIRTAEADRSPFKYDWIGQKCFNGSCPLGPWIVPASAIPNPQSVSIGLSVNGQVRQDSNTDQMIFTLAEQIAHLSSRLTLRAGDIILTGTPAGVGGETGQFLKSGDVVRVALEGLGLLTTTIGNLSP